MDRLHSKELKGSAYTSELIPFGETVAGHFPQKYRKMMESDRHLGIWVGRTNTSNEHILFTQGGVLRCKSVRRLKFEERHNKQSPGECDWSTLGDQRPNRDPMQT